MPANSVAVIDPHGNTVAGSAPVGSRPGAIAFGSGSLWVANVDDQTVSRIDPGTLRPVRTLAVGDPPTGIAASANAVWVVGSNPNASSVSVDRSIPVRCCGVGGRVRVGNVVPGGPGEVAAHGDAVWVAPSSGVLARLNPTTGRVVQRIDPNTGPAAIDIGDGAVWVTDTFSDNVTRVDPTGLATPIAVGGGPSGIAVGEGGVWVADSLDNTVTRIDPNTRAVTMTIPVGRSPAGVAAGAGSVWVANSGDGTVTRIDPRPTRCRRRSPSAGVPRRSRRERAGVGDRRCCRGHAERHGGRHAPDRLPIDVDYMDPARASTVLSQQLLYATCAKLLNYPDMSGAAGRQLKAEVASSLPTRSADGKTYTFTIRPGFRFSPPSNQPVTAQTFKDTIERTLNPSRHPSHATAEQRSGGARVLHRRSGPAVSRTCAR